MITYRNATCAELAQVLDWAALEGWNPGLDDAAAFFAADPGGFFVAVDDTGSLLAAISVVNHNDRFAFLGLYIVRPACRGQGIGLGLWRHAIAHAGARTIGLDGVEAQQHNYAASGFGHAGGTTRFSGSLAGARDAAIRAATAPDIQPLIEREAAASGAAKPDYLRAWFTQTAQRKTLVLDAGDTGPGFCTVRACRSGAKIGPLCADDADTAHRLILQAATLYQGDITIDVPETATSLAELCRALHLSPGFRTARMYRGTFRAQSHPNFAVASLELG